jgi:replicative DNA helicase
VKRIAAAALIGRYWPSKAHDAAMALAGGLLRAGMPVEDAEKFIAAVCCIANDGDPKNRIETVRYTKKKLDANENVTGWPTLADLLTDGGEKITRQVCDWVGARVGGPIGSKPIRADDIDSTEASLPNPDGVPDKPNLIGQTGARSTESNKAGWQWDLISSKEFISAEFKTRWLVKRLFVADEPAIIAGPMKTLKTTVAIDLAVSLGTATPFLGKFDVYNRTRVAVISGESGKPALQDTFRRVCDKRLVAPESADIQWGFRLPSFANVLDMRTLGECAAANDVKFVIADPAYLCTLAGIDPNDSKNIFAMGAHLARFAEAVLAAGATPCIVHHSNRQIVQGRPMELSDLAYSGFAEFSAQWYLLNRMSAFKGDGRHELIANAGGRQGQGGQWVLSIDEGQLNDDFTGRRWEVEVTPASEHRQEQQDDKKAQKKAEKDAAAEGADDELWRRLRMQPDHTQTKSYMRGVLKWSGDDINMSIARLMDQGRLIATKMKKPTGKGTRPIDAIRAIEPGDDLNPDNPEVQVKSPDSPSSGQEDG